MQRETWKVFWKLRGQEQRLRRQIITAQRNVQKAEARVKQRGVLTPIAVRAQQKLLELSERHLELHRQLISLMSLLPRKRSF